LNIPQIFSGYSKIDRFEQKTTPKLANKIASKFTLFASIFNTINNLSTPRKQRASADIFVVYGTTFSDSARPTIIAELTLSENSS
jgi:hypothetical protein